MARGLVGRDDAADRRADDEVDAAGHLRADLFRKRAAQGLGQVGVHEDARLLQEDGAAQPRAQDEVAFENGAGAPEDADHLALVHYLLSAADVSR